jgi:hypothetical protein
MMQLGTSSPPLPSEAPDPRSRETAEIPERRSTRGDLYSPL